jgi:hypothetical protein
VNCRDSRLQGVSTETARSPSALGERDAFGDLISIPQRAILPVQQDQLSFCRASSGAARFLQQHESQQAHHFGLRKKVEEQFYPGGSPRGSIQILLLPLKPALKTRYTT